MTVFLCVCMYLYIHVGVYVCMCLYGCVHMPVCTCLGKLEAGSDHRGESYKGLMPEWVLDCGESQAKYRLGHSGPATRHRLRGAASEQSGGARRSHSGRLRLCTVIRAVQGPEEEQGPRAWPRASLSPS